MKLLYVDVETTGLVKYKHGIITLAYIIEDEHKLVEAQGEIRMNPYSYAHKSLDKKAFEAHNITEDEFKTYQDAKAACLQFIAILQKYATDEKYKVVGYNVEFDTGFLQVWMDKLVPNTYWKLIDYKWLDPFQDVKKFKYYNMIKTKNDKLGTICEYFGIEHEAHNAMSDIIATRQLFKLFEEVTLSVRARMTEKLHEGLKHDSTM